ncbi:MAG TPA: hypothetical protein VFP28_00745, partial [Gemmatimonadales bacterium]|nr:hypothetical protein [Gemmatimonadales bacterium]
MFVASHRAAACDSEISLESRNAESGHFAATPPVCCTRITLLRAWPSPISASTGDIHDHCCSHGVGRLGHLRLP